ncbi:TetR/AcrR family transcriptional regulator [Mycolicibacterium flavescens]|uniref:TetR family transcriptional regulator n=1 Tax=Mycolicibacterium flavescens TaxID=1776 RepID=A0A1E3RRN2_MYCFV|nr:TetR/AcrR family transcriptional regulator [Mycolicibacterium flavescens]MCV7279892.1 TetR/AcrR family transcriptional regulator [Mycolicibacterium flavescens]ODQ92508.1 TetR family transcriptional regulator [Mycolicibacterium flavescens]
MTEQVDRRSDATRQQILRAASHLFARSPYSRVSLDDILADAEVTKGAMYFHFRSKYALALAIVDLRVVEATTSVQEVLERKMSGLETLVDLSYLVATDDIGDETARAGLNLVESIGRTDSLQSDVLGQWVDAFAAVIRKAIGEGDIAADADPQTVGRLLVSIYMGLRQTSDLDDPDRFLNDLQAAWRLVLPGLTTPDRLPYLFEFVKRRTAVSTRTVTPLR